MREKLYYTIGEIAEFIGVPTHNIRYWEKEIPSIAPKQRVGGKRAYKKEDVDKIKHLYNLLHNQRLTIEGAKKILLNGQGTLFTEMTQTNSTIVSIKEEIQTIIKLVENL